MSMSLLWQLLQRDNPSMVNSIKSEEDLRRIIQPKKHTTQSNFEGKQIIRSVMQTREQLLLVVEDICITAIEDNVACTVG